MRNFHLSFITVLTSFKFLEFNESNTARFTIINIFNPTGQHEAMSMMWFFSIDSPLGSSFFPFFYVYLNENISTCVYFREN